MVATAAARGRDALVVSPGGAVLLGISGHEVATIPGLTDVRPQGEQGPYTVVAYEGRHGYVLTDSLVRKEDLEATSSEALDEPVAEPGSDHKRATRLRQIAAGFIATAGIAAAVYAYISFPIVG